MIAVPRSLARRFRAVLRRSILAVGPRDPPPAVRLRAGPDGLTLAADHPECAVVCHAPGRFNQECLAFPAKVLQEVEGRDDSLVSLESVKFGRGKASWSEGGVPRGVEFATVVPDSLDPLPEMPGEFVPMRPGFLGAFADAAQTAARDSARYALSRVLLRGQAGELIASDGRQLLLQAGFAWPWKDDVLVAAVPVFAGPELPAESSVVVGRTESHVTLQIGSWTVHLRIDAGGRYPDVRAVIPSADGKTSRLKLSEEDAHFLVRLLGRLPGKEEHTPVTLDLADPVAIRSRGGESPQVHELVLAGSRHEGAAVRVVCNRRYLWRAAKLGFRELQISAPNRPLLCRDDSRTYVFMPLEKDAAVPPATDARRISSADGKPARIGPEPTQERSKPVMPGPPNESPPRNGATRHQPPPTPEQEQLDLIAETEALRSLLHEAQGRLGRLLAALKQHRRQSRTLQAAVASLQNLRLDR